MQVGTFLNAGRYSYLNISSSIGGGALQMHPAAASGSRMHEEATGSHRTYALPPRIDVLYQCRLALNWNADAEPRVAVAQVAANGKKPCCRTAGRAPTSWTWAPCRPAAHSKSAW